MDDASFVLIRILGDLLSPSRCAACDVDVVRSQIFCAPCAATVERNAPTTDASDEIAFGQYGGALGQAIRRFKYEDRPYLARPLGDLLRSLCRVEKVEADAVVPVPLHPRRLVDRGYNQSALLAARVAAEIHAPLVTAALARTSDTIAQASLTRRARQANMAEAFRVAVSGSVQGRMVVLVDDVSTTGATLAGCASALLAAGVQGVMKMVLARTPPSALGIPLELDSGAVPDVGVLSLQASSGCANVPIRANLRA